MSLDSKTSSTLSENNRVGEASQGKKSTQPNSLIWEFVLIAQGVTSTARSWGANHRGNTRGESNKNMQIQQTAERNLPLAEVIHLSPAQPQTRDIQTK